MVGIHERTRVDLASSNGVCLIPEIVIRVQGAAVPPVLRISMEGISAGLRDVVDVRSRQATKLPAIAVGHNAGFLHVVQAQG